jgi:hypothetical protein
MGVEGRMSILDLSDAEIEQSYALTEAMQKHMEGQECKIVLTAALDNLYLVLSTIHGDDFAEKEMDYIEDHLEDVIDHHKDYDKPMPFGRRQRRAKAK